MGWKVVSNWKPEEAADSKTFTHGGQNRGHKPSDSERIQERPDTAFYTSRLNQEEQIYFLFLKLVNREKCG